MPSTVASPLPASPRVQEVLLGYLQTNLNWPGADGVTVEEVLLSYFALAEMGRVPGRLELLRRHPDLAVELDVYFASVKGDKKE